jgi:predicted nucleotidyltransferase
MPADPDPQLLEQLRDAAARIGDVDLLVLFGSQACGRAHAASDVDVAVLVRDATPPRKRRVELELLRAGGDRIDTIFLDEAPHSSDSKSPDPVCPSSRGSPGYGYATASERWWTGGTGHRSRAACTPRGSHGSGVRRRGGKSRCRRAKAGSRAGLALRRRGALAAASRSVSRQRRIARSRHVLSVPGDPGGDRSRPAGLRMPAGKHRTIRGQRSMCWRGAVGSR